jgi:hypothetical protein
LSTQNAPPARTPPPPALAPRALPLASAAVRKALGGKGTAESDLEDALLDRLQDFLLELGHGFCFEARQKRVLIGDEHFFIDLVFYHRVLKCHILVELKTDAFQHEHLGQLIAYARMNKVVPPWSK